VRAVGGLRGGGDTEGLYNPAPRESLTRPLP
jgi:hypothetical protein